MDMTLALMADMLMIAAAIGAAIYCIVLGRRLKRFNNLENGMGGAIAVLSAQVDDLTKTLDRAQSSAKESAKRLEDLSERGDAAAQRLELLMASMHDLPLQDKPAKPTQTPAHNQEQQDSATVSFRRSAHRDRAVNGTGGS